MDAHLPFSFKQQPAKRQVKRKEDNRREKQLAVANDLIS
jgi:hypothetical protein